MRAELRACAARAAAVFGLGVLPGPVRGLALAPRLGATAAAALEAVPMLIGMAIPAPWLARRPEVPPARPAQVGMGGAGLALPVLAETALDRLVRGQCLWIERMRSPAGRTGLGLLAAFALMPALRGA
jgi:hypothetical protein